MSQSEVANLAYIAPAGAGAAHLRADPPVVVSVWVRCFKSHSSAPELRIVIFHSEPQRARLHACLDRATYLENSR